MIVNMHSAKSNLSKLVKAAAEGESVAIAVNGTPKVDLVPHKQIPPREFGCLKEDITTLEDFDSKDTNQSIEQLFEQE